MKSESEIVNDSPFDLLPHLSPNIRYIIWASSTSLEKKPWPLEGLDYVFDGLLTHSISEKKSLNSKNNVFMTKNFGQSLTLIYLNAEVDNIKSLNLDLLKNVTENELMVICEKKGTTEHWPDSLKKKISKSIFKK